MAATELRDAGAGPPLIHLSELLLSPVVTTSGEVIGTVDDVVARLRHKDVCPVLAGIVAGVGSGRLFVASASIRRFGPDRVILAHRLPLDELLRELPR
ncbi:PRC-barrel domain-containing protein [Mycobacterium sp. SM1]|uniref:PRC-barrel domain-containing protein n=1 Tax=Mycobacterium sp. SM1 TaxID=2816243 RepID=UPI001BCD45AA|nr:PRC-barrel domain-containing protein [Mycobacterium sp. SM1]MBS4730207.1 PRC-barrel domain-containing protein [Mycobacterium sp. SM1]